MASDNDAFAAAPLCAICDSSIVTPVTVGQKCGHVFCLPCSISLLQGSVSLSNQYASSTAVWVAPRCSMKPVTCPLCRDPHEYKEFTFTGPSMATWPHSTGTVCVFCTSYQSGNYTTLLDHLNHCPSRWIRCPLCRVASEVRDSVDHPLTYAQRLQIHLDTECAELRHQCGGCWRRGTKEAATRCSDVHSALGAIDHAIAHTALEIEALRQMDGDRSANAANNNALIGTCRHLLVQLSASFGVRQPVANPEFTEMVQMAQGQNPPPQPPGNNNAQPQSQPATDDEDDDDEDDEEESEPEPSLPRAPPAPPGT